MSKDTNTPIHPELANPSTPIPNMSKDEKILSAFVLVMPDGSISNDEDIYRKLVDDPYSRLPRGWGIKFLDIPVES